MRSLKLTGRGRPCSRANELKKTAPKLRFIANATQVSSPSAVFFAAATGLRLNRPKAARAAGAAPGNQATVAAGAEQHQPHQLCQQSVSDIDLSSLLNFLNSEFWQFIDLQNYFDIPEDIILPITFAQQKFL